ncbi:hypothetical protein CD943_04570 [Brevundimonas diminuta]|uniref:HTH araC/xylS-type domain-containing protein n=2 Tax=Brevundimonas diminuta TaxID=293 RepID=A0A1Z3LVS7_BREDI|nr:hypothetical protein CD943_04570 [Brevundimonas diminuta]
MSWGMPLLYAGPAFELPAHRKAVGLFCVCLDGDMAVQIIGGAGERREVTGRSVFIDPGVMHRIRFQAGRIACLYTDGANADHVPIAIGMKPVAPGVSVEHPGLGPIIDVLADEDALSSLDRRRVAEAFGSFGSRRGLPDPRISRAADMILSDPVQSHSAANIARSVGLSESRLRHVFRRSQGVSLRRFRLWARMGAGLSLIGAGANLTRAAHEAGFSSSAHFSTAYRGFFGLKPSAVVRANPMLGVSRRAARRPEC